MDCADSLLGLLYVREPEAIIWVSNSGYPMDGDPIGDYPTTLLLRIWHGPSGGYVWVVADTSPRRTLGVR
jgi:hypothetical protein